MMLPNDHHPGPRCSCPECLRRYPEGHSLTNERDAFEQWYSSKGPNDPRGLGKNPQNEYWFPSTQWVWKAWQSAVEWALADEPSPVEPPEGPAALVDALQDVVHTDPGPVRAGRAVKCEQCGMHEAMHKHSKKDGWLNLCCECHVKAGAPPADWHPQCMRVWQEKQSAALRSADSGKP